MREPFSPPTNTLDPAELFTDIHLYFFLHHHSSAITFRVQITGAKLACLHKRPFPAGNHPPTLWACVYWLLIFHFPHTNTHSHSSNFPTGKRTLFFRPPQQLLITTINWCFSHPCPPRQTCQLNIFVVVVFPPWWTCTFTEIQLIYILFNFLWGCALSISNEKRINQSNYSLVYFFIFPLFTGNQFHTNSIARSLSCWVCETPTLVFHRQTIPSFFNASPSAAPLLLWFTGPQVIQLSRHRV